MEFNVQLGGSGGSAFVAPTLVRHPSNHGGGWPNGGIGGKQGGGGGGSSELILKSSGRRLIIAAGGGGGTPEQAGQAYDEAHLYEGPSLTPHDSVECAADKLSAPQGYSPDKEKVRPKTPPISAAAAAAA